jgi:uncharacterized protein with PIN domain
VLARLWEMPVSCPGSNLRTESDNAVDSGLQQPVDSCRRYVKRASNRYPVYRCENCGSTYWVETISEKVPTLHEGSRDYSK